MVLIEGIIRFFRTTNKPLLNSLPIHSIPLYSQVLASVQNTKKLFKKSIYNFENNTNNSFHIRGCRNKLLFTLEDMIIYIFRKYLKYLNTRIFLTRFSSRIELNPHRNIIPIVDLSCCCNIDHKVFHRSRRDFCYHFNQLLTIRYHFHWNITSINFFLDVLDCIRKIRSLTKRMLFRSNDLPNKQLEFSVTIVQY